MISAAFAALGDILTPPFRGVLLKSLAMTLALLAVLWGALWGGVQWGTASYVDMPTWLDVTVGILTGVGLVFGMGFLVAPVTSLLAGLFLDEIAEVVEKTRYPADPPGVALPLGTALWEAAKFFGIVLLGNICALALLLVPGVNLVAFFVVNGYLLGREYFEAVASRFRTPAEARALRSANGFTVFCAGLVIALFLAIPIVNLAAPLFATAFMSHLHKRIEGRRPSA